MLDRNIENLENKKQVIFSLVDNEIAILTLNRPEKLNTLNEELMSDLNYFLEKIEQNHAIKVIILRGAGRAFSAGLDIEKIKNATTSDLIMSDFLGERWFKLEKMIIPIIAEISGFALGGGLELALMCDFIIAGENAIFGFPEVNLGIMPGLGGTQKLLQKVGIQNAYEIIMLGDKFSAKTAQKYGLISEIYKNPDNSSLELAQKIAKKSKSSIISIKSALKKQISALYDQNFERSLFRSLFSTTEQKNGFDNFFHKK